MPLDKRYTHPLKVFFELLYTAGNKDTPLGRIIDSKRNHKFAILITLAIKEPIKVKTLRGNILCSNRAFDCYIKHLKEEGLIESDTNADDKRAKCVQLTKLGRESLKNFFEDIISRRTL